VVGSVGSSVMVVLAEASAGYLATAYERGQ
jgi:hypothetical protein